ncbi:MAG: phosphatase PAP2 family protein [Caulobacteraceae bacterium]
MLQRVPLLGKLRGVQPLAWLLCVSAVLFFVQVADEMVEGQTLRVDRLLILALRQPGRPDTPIGPLWLQQAAIDISGLGGFTVLTLLSAMAVGFLVVLHRWREAWVLVATWVGAILAKSALKAVFARPRPDLVSHLALVSDASFPSGHAMMSAVIYLTLGSLLAQTQPLTRMRIYILSVAVVLVLLIGVSRIFLGVHWPSDVLAGWCLGSAWAMGSWLLVRALKLAQ